MKYIKSPNLSTVSKCYIRCTKCSSSTSEHLCSLVWMDCCAEWSQHSYINYATNVAHQDVSRLFTSTLSYFSSIFTLLHKVKGHKLKIIELHLKQTGILKNQS